MVAKPPKPCHCWWGTVSKVWMSKPQKATDCSTNITTMTIRMNDEWWWLWWWRWWRWWRWYRLLKYQDYMIIWLTILKTSSASGSFRDTRIWPAVYVVQGTPNVQIISWSTTLSGAVGVGWGRFECFDTPRPPHYVKFAIGLNGCINCGRLL